MAGLIPADESPETAQALYVRRLREAAGLAAAQGVSLMIEPINRRDMPGYFLHRQDQAHALLDEIAASNVQVQMDLYHAQISEGDLSTKLRQYLPSGRVGHLQIAGVPERYEPDVGEINYRHLFRLLDELGYAGWVGCEYRPARGVTPGATSQGLAWLRGGF